MTFSSINRYLQIALSIVGVIIIITTHISNNNLTIETPSYILGISILLANCLRLKKSLEKFTNNLITFLTIGVLIWFYYVWGLSIFGLAFSGATIPKMLEIGTYYAMVHLLVIISQIIVSTIKLLTTRK